MEKNKTKIGNFIFKTLNKLNSRYVNFEKNTDVFQQSLDSLDFMKLIFILEKKYKLKIDSKDFKNIQTINKLSKYIHKKI